MGQKGPSPIGPCLARARAMPGRACPLLEQAAQARPAGPIFGPGWPRKHGLRSRTGQLEPRVAVEPWGSAVASHAEEPKVEAT